MGNSLLDFSVNCDEEFVRRYGFEIDYNYEAKETQMSLFTDLLNRKDAVVTPGNEMKLKWPPNYINCYF